MQRLFWMRRHAEEEALHLQQAIFGERLQNSAGETDRAHEDPTSLLGRELRGARMG